MRTVYWRSILLAAWLALLTWAAVQATPGTAYDFQGASAPRASTP
ncbi:MAG TPA: hypothetical protein VGC55_16620 [Dokdonella sp.]